MLTTLIQNAADHAGFTLTDMDAFAIAMGPGSYTGLRIAVSTAKGLCFALDKPLIAVNTLEAMTRQLNDFYPDHVLFCPMLDARRMEVYCALFDKALNFVLPTQAKIITSDSFSEVLATHPVVFFGDGAEKCKTLFGANPNAVFPDTPVFPSAKTVGWQALRRFEHGQFEDLSSFEPYYLKDFMTTTPKKRAL